jgi:5-formyltetrahydrofolate cyclo-ligase
MNPSDPHDSLDVSNRESDLDRNRLRREMRQRRRALPQSYRAAAAANLAKVISRHRILRHAARLAVYLAYRGEIDLAPTIALARRRGCRLCLPVITSIAKGSMHFAPFETGTSLHRNRFGIHEPRLHRSQAVPVRRLDVILLPLVAVDARGWRLGSGAGFYDRRLSHLRTDRRWRRPRLIGVAYEFQRVPAIDPQSWDVPLDAIVTERGYYPLHRRLFRNPARGTP